PSPWEQLQWERYPKLWQKFRVYDLPEPDDDAIIDVLAATISNTDITPKPEQYPKIASSNDRTFRNVVENLRRLENDNLPLNIGNYRPSLGKTWEKRYQEAVKRYPAAKYVYDAVDLLRQFDISLERFIIEATANLIVKGNIWERLWCRFQIRSALNYLVEIERIKNPRDGQIEAKEYQVEASEYASSLSNLFLKIIDKYPQKLEDSLTNFGQRLSRINFYKEEITLYDKALGINPDLNEVWNHRGVALENLKRHEEAIISYDKALLIKPDSYSPWNNRGIALRKLKRYEEAITCYDKALGINPNYYHIWNNKGFPLEKLKLYEEAVTCYDKALEIKPDFHEAWYNRGLSLLYLKRYEEAIFSYDKALEIKSDDTYDKLCWHKRGISLLYLKRYKEAIVSYDKALEINPSFDYALRSRGLCYLVLQQYEKAIIDLNRAIDLKKDSDWYLYLRALAYKALNQPDKAQTDLENAVKLAKPKYENNPLDWNNTLDLALYYLAANYIPTAKKLYELALSQDISQGYIDMAIRDLDDFLMVFPNHTEAQAMRVLLDSK
ncbi:MAG: tetratricopeptide repeat protein, partial [Cyanobacteria bacterium J06643_5]